MKGRKPVPTALKLIRGNPGKRPINHDEPKPKPATIRPPKGLSPLAKKHWRDVAKRLSEAGLLTTLDVHALQLECEAWATWTKACQMIEENGETTVGSHGGVVPSPWIRIREKAFEQLKWTMSEFGRTPVARSRVKVDPKKPDDGFGEFA